MSGPLSAPWTEIGRLQSDISNLESKLNQKADSHEIRSINSKMADLERSVGEVRSMCDGFQSQLQVIQEGLRQAAGY